MTKEEAQALIKTYEEKMNLLGRYLWLKWEKKENRKVNRNAR